MLSVLMFVVAIFAILIALTMLRDRPSNASAALIVAVVAVIAGVGFAIWGEQRWDTCSKNAIGDYYESSASGKAVSRCPDKALGMRTPF